jgi:CRP/FNR family transcriptional regulator, cyclic AMP receptor protein
MSGERAGPSPNSLTPGTFAALLEPEQWSRLQELGHTVRFPARAVLMSEREESDLVMILLGGHVKTTLVGDGGREALLSFRDPGDVLGELSAIDGEPRVATVTAIDPVTAIVVPAPLFRRHLESTPRVAVVLLAVVTRRFREATLLRVQFGSSDTIGRLAARLVELADRYGTLTEHGILITLALSQEELGAWAGASRAGLANALRTLRELGWVATQRRRILVLDIESLRERAA